jgi:hypothetical protein
MIKRTLCIAAALVLSACGGGGSDSPAPATSIKNPTLSFYGNPLAGNTVKSSAKAATDVASDASAATAPVSASDAAAQTVATLQDALAAQGVTATVTPQVMDGTTLHALIMGENNGLPPTDDQFKTDPNGFLVVNFVLDDMVTPLDDPKQQAALAQFRQDMYVFIQRAHVAGKLVYPIVPIPTCDVPMNLNGAVGARDAADGVIQAIGNAAGQAGGFPVGGLPSHWVTDAATNVTVDTYTQGHLGADCRTPDAWLTTQWLNSIATPIAAAMKAGN